MTMPPIDPVLIEALSGARQPTIAGSGQTRINPALTQAMMAQGLRPGPVTSKTQAFARIGTAAIGGVLENLRADQIQAVRQRIALSLEGLPGVGPEELRFAQSLLSAGKYNEAISFTKAARDRAARVKEFGVERASKEKIEANKLLGKAPASRTRISGDKTIFEQFNPETRQFEEISRGPRNVPSRSEIEKLMDEAGLKGKERKQAARAILEGKGSFQLEVGADGSLRISRGGRGSKSGLSKKFQGVVEVELEKATSGLADLVRIKDSFNPSFLTFGTKAELWLLNFADRLGFEISPEDEQLLGDASVFKRNAYAALNLYIKRITGAQMSEAEAKRLTKAFTDPEKDGPTIFAAKLKDLIKTTRESVARLYYIKEKGFTLDRGSFAGPRIPGIHTGLRNRKTGAPVASQMSKIMGRHYLENFEKMRKLRPKASKEDIATLARGRTARQFGLIAR